MTAIALLLPAGILFLILSSLAVHRWGYYAFAGIVPIFAATMFLTASYHEFFVFLTSAIIIGSLIGILVRGKKSVQFFITIASLTCTIFSYGSFLYVNKVMKIDTISQSKAQWLEIIDASKADPAEKTAFKENMDGALTILRSIMPFNFFLNGLFWSTVIYLFLRIFFKRKIIQKGIQIKGIERYRLNDYLIFLLIGSLAVFIAAGSKNKIVYMVSLNCLLILTTLYIIQALGIVKYFLLKKHLPTSLLPATMLLILLLGIEATVFVSMLLAGCGALDLWADFRKLNGGGKPAGGDI